MSDRWRRPTPPKGPPCIPAPPPPPGPPNPFITSRDKSETGDKSAIFVFERIDKDHLLLIEEIFVNDSKLFDAVLEQVKKRYGV